MKALKRCDTGNHDVPVLFHSRKPGRPSCCPGCYRGKGIQKTMEVAEKPSNGVKSSKREQSLGHLIELAVIVMHKWIKKRDTLNGYYACISCDTIDLSINAHAGHFINAGNHSSTRFHEDNINLQCPQCNLFLNGNYWMYRRGLILKIGLERVEYIEQLSKQRFKWDRSEIQEIINKYK